MCKEISGWHQMMSLKTYGSSSKLEKVIVPRVMSRKLLHASDCKFGQNHTIHNIDSRLFSLKYSKAKISPYIFCQKYQTDDKYALFRQLSNLALISAKATITPAKIAVE